MATVLATFILPPSPHMPAGYQLGVTLREVQWLREQVKVFRDRNGAVPDNDVGLHALLKTTPPLLEKVPPDVWGNLYVYKQSSSGEGFVVYSVGLNGVDEDGAGDDITGPGKSYSCAEYEVDCPLKQSDFLRFYVLVCLFVGLPAFLICLGVLVYRRERSNAA